MPKRIKLRRAALIILPILAALTHSAFATERTVTIIPDKDAVKKARIQEIKESPRFQQYVNEQAELRYYESVRDEAGAALREIEGTEEKKSADAASMLRAYLAPRNKALAGRAEEIVKLPRWREVVGIIGKETSFCTKGVGASRKNCGAIKNAAGEFKRYASEMDAVEDIAILLGKPRYAGRTIQEINGTYCVDETQPGNRCPGWDVQILAIASELGSET